MFCSNCGAADQSPNAYCKRCGEWLADKKSFGGRGGSKPEKRMTAMIVFNGLSALLALFSDIALRDLSALRKRNGLSTWPELVAL